MSPSDPRVLEGGEGGDPAPEVVAVIVAAVEVTWPRPAPAVSEGSPSAIPWRFSGRWWLGRSPRAAGRRR